MSEGVEMRDFIYYAPTKVVFGRDSERAVPGLLKSFGAKKTLVHYGGGSAVRSGLIGRIKSYLEAERLEYVTLGGVLPNPRLATVYEGIEYARQEGADFILAVGGGSVIDSAKAIAYGLAYEGDVWDLFEGKAKALSSFPVGAVLTIAAAGSEMSESCVISKVEMNLHEKRGYTSELGRCKFAVMNPELTYTTPREQTVNGVVDILMHAMERYFSRDEGLDTTRSLAEAVMRGVVEYGRVALKEPQNYRARAELMWSGSLAHNGLMGLGAAGDWATHQLAHELSAMYDSAHGASLSALWGAWAKYVYEECPRPFARFAVNVMGVKSAADERETALAGIAALLELYKELGSPTNLRELGVKADKEQAELLAKNCSRGGKRTVGTFKELTGEDMRRIYIAAC